MFSTCCCSSLDDQKTIDVIDTHNAVTQAVVGAAATSQNERVDPEDAKTGQAAPAINAKGADQDSRRSKPAEYTVAIDKGGVDAPLGLDCEPLGECLLVIGIDDGAVKKHNETAAPEVKINVGDFVFSVNGESGEKARAALLSKVKTLQMVLTRPMAFTISLKKADGSVGLDLDYLTNGACLLVTQIKPGAAMEWNDANRSVQVKVEDRIIGVNGKKGQAEFLLETIQQDRTQVELQMLRPADR